MTKQEYNGFQMDIAMKMVFVQELFLKEEKDNIDLPSKCRHCVEKTYESCKDHTLVCNHKDNPTNITKLYTFMVQLDGKIDSLMKTAFNDGYVARLKGVEDER